jgi:transcription elongation factor GreA
MTGTWLSQAAFNRLTAELVEMQGPIRAEIVQKIAAAREEGDLKENGGYHAAKDEQGKLEARIRQLRHMLEHAQVGKAPTGDPEIVGLGWVVTVDIVGEVLTFLLGSREGAGAGEEYQSYSEKSPLGAAVFGARIGTTVAYFAPSGKRIEVAILEAFPHSG